MTFEAIVHDHYQNADFTLNLADGQTMITSIDEVNAKALILGQRWTGYVAAEITEKWKRRSSTYGQIHVAEIRY